MISAKEAFELANKHFPDEEARVIEKMIKTAANKGQVWCTYIIPSGYSISQITAFLLNHGYTVSEQNQNTREIRISFKSI